MNLETIKIEDTVVLFPHLDAAERVEHGNLNQMRNEAGRLIKEGVLRMVFDLSEVEFLNSTEIGMLMGITKQMTNAKGIFLVCGVGLRLAETLALVRVLSIIPVRLTRQEALLAIKRERLSEKSMIQLATGNPTLESIRSWWDSVILSRSAESSNARPAVAAPVAVPEPTEPPTPPDSDPLPSVALEPRGVAKDWLAALECLRVAKQLYEKRGGTFSADMTFKEFVGNIAQKLLVADDSTGGMS